MLSPAYTLPVDELPALPEDYGRRWTRPLGALLRWPPVRRPGFWLAFWTGWTFFVLLFAGRTYLMEPGTDVGTALARAMADQYTWALVCLAAFALGWRYPLTPRTWRRNLAVIVLLVPAVTLGRMLVMEGVMREVVAGYAPKTLGQMLVLAFPHQLVPTLGLTGAVHAMEYFCRYRERETAASRLEARLSRARLDVLKIQLHPHFLFNTLNSVSTLMYRDVAAADGTLARLAQMLRLTLNHSGAQEVPLAEELEFVRLYLEIQQTRFGERLRVEWAVEPAAERARVPHLLLQPLVENAIRHGVAPRRGPGTVRIGARREGAELLLEVRDDGLGLPAGWTPERCGVGLANTVARLEQLHGARQRFEIGDAPEGGVRVAIHLPFRLAPAGAAAPAPAAAD